MNEEAAAAEAEMDEEGDGSAVDHEHFLLPPWAVVMDGTGDELFSGATFASDKDGGIGLGNAADHLHDVLKRA